MSDAAISAPAPDPQATGRPPVVLNRRDCDLLLRRTSVGRVGFVDDGWPMILPVNYAFDGDDIVFRTAAGRKHTVLRREAPVSLEIDSVESVHRAGWSVLAFGYASEVVDQEALTHLKALGVRAWAAGSREFWIRIRLTQVTGRRLPKGWQYPDRVD
jgi:nitroimidazol reductase NimA-like FMN-containing flavoprotein (pyridoxamine 5'-phosphate oxidase superfamily)